MATHSHTNTKEISIHPHEHIILSMHTCMSIDPLHIHTHEHRSSPYTHEHRYYPLHTYEHIIHIHMNTSLHGQLTEMRDRSRERCKEEVRARPEKEMRDWRPSSITYVTSKASSTC